MPTNEDDRAGREWKWEMAQMGKGSRLGIGTGNPGVFQGYPYPNPSLPVPLGGVRVYPYTGNGVASHTVTHSVHHM